MWQWGRVGCDGGVAEETDFCKIGRMPLSDIEKYFEHLDNRTYSAFAQRGAEPSEAKIGRFEQEVGFRFPEEFREFSLKPLGGFYIEVREGLWPRPQRGDRVPSWTFLYGFRVYSFSPRAPEWMNIRTAWRQMGEQGSPHLVPFLKIMGDADPYCFTRDRKIVIWRHEIPEEPDPVEMTFSEVVVQELRDLENRKNRQLAEQRW
jgi:hypothetical protein